MKVTPEQIEETIKYYKGLLAAFDKIPETGVPYNPEMAGIAILLFHIENLKKKLTGWI